MSSSKIPSLTYLIEQLSSSKSHRVYNALVTLRTRVIKQSDGTARFRQSGGLEPLLTVLKQTNKKLLDITLSILGNCSMEQETRVKISKLGGIELIGGLLKSVEAESLQNRACRTLANLALDPACCALFHEQENLLGRVITLAAKTEDKDCKQTYIRAIRLFADNKKNKNRVLQNEGLKVVVECLRSEEVGVVREALTALSHFTQNECCELYEQQLVAGDGAVSLLRLADHDDVTLSHAATSLVLSMAKQELLRPVLGSAGAVDYFIRVINEDHVTTNQKLSFISALSQMCREAVNRKKIRLGGGLELFPTLLKDDIYIFIHDRLISALVCFLYDDLSMEILLQAGIVQTLVKHLSKVIGVVPRDWFLDNGDRLETPTNDTQPIVSCDSSVCDTVVCDTAVCDNLESRQVSRPELNVNTTELNVNTTELNVNTTELNVNTTELNVNTTELNVNTTELNVNTTELNVNTTELNVNTTELNVNTTELNVNTTGDHTQCCSQRQDAISDIVSCTKKQCTTVTQSEAGQYKTHGTQVNANLSSHWRNSIEVKKSWENVNEDSEKTGGIPDIDTGSKNRDRNVDVATQNAQQQDDISETNTETIQRAAQQYDISETIADTDTTKRVDSSDVGTQCKQERYSMDSPTYKAVSEFTLDTNYDYYSGPRNILEGEQYQQTVSRGVWFSPPHHGPYSPLSTSSYVTADWSPNLSPSTSPSRSISPVLLDVQYSETTSLSDMSGISHEWPPEDDQQLSLDPNAKEERLFQWSPVHSMEEDSVFRDDITTGDPSLVVEATNINTQGLANKTGETSSCVENLSDMSGNNQLNSYGNIPNSDPAYCTEIMDLTDVGAVLKGEHLFPSSREVTKGDDISSPRDVIKGADISSPHDVIKGEDISSPHDVIKGEDILSPRDVIKDGDISSPHDVIKGEDISSPHDVIKGEDISSPRDVIKDGDISSPHDVIKGEDISSPHDVIKGGGFASPSSTTSRRHSEPRQVKKLFPSRGQGVKRKRGHTPEVRRKILKAVEGQRMNEAIDLDGMLSRRSSTSSEHDSDMKSHISASRVTEQNIIILLSRVSCATDPSPYMFREGVINCLLNYVTYAKDPFPRASRTLLRLVKNRHCFESIITQCIPFSFYLKLHSLTVQRSSDVTACSSTESTSADIATCSKDNELSESESEHSLSAVQSMPSLELFEKLLISLSIVAESRYGSGTLIHILRTATREQKLRCALCLLFICRSNSLRWKFLVENNALDILLQVFHSSYKLSGTSVKRHLSADPTASVDTEMSGDSLVYLRCVVLTLSYLFNKLDLCFVPTLHSEHKATSSLVRSSSQDLTYDLQFVLDDGKRVRAQRAVLVSASCVFTAMLQGHYSESSQNEIRIPHISSNSLQLLMDYLHGLDVQHTCQYLCQESKGLDTLLEVLALSNQYLINDLHQLVAQYISKYSLNSHVISDVYTFAVIHNADWLARQCVYYIYTAVNDCTLQVEAISQILASQEKISFMSKTKELIIEKIKYRMFSP